MGNTAYDIAIIGGAVMGSSAAFWLSKFTDPSTQIVVIEPDPSYKNSSTALSVASIRQQFTTDINVKISRYGIEFIKNVTDHFDGLDAHVNPLSLKENGYLFLSGTPQSSDAMRDAVVMQNQYGAQTRLFTPDALKSRFSWLNTSDVDLASYGAVDEGWFDNMALLDGFRRAARAKNVEYIRDSVCGFGTEKGRICQIKLASGQRIDAGIVINAAGTSAADIMRYLHEDIPVEARKRTVFMIDAPNAIHPDAPLLVCHSGFYLRPEHGHWICAMVPEKDEKCAADDFEPDLKLFEDDLWERLYHRAPGFDAVKVLSAWAGHYAYNTLDQNAIIGKHPNWDNLYLMNGFSGHGLQQAPAIGRGIAELITTGAYQSINFKDLGVERVLTGQPFRENAIV